MFVTRKALKRRTFLRGMGATVALPLLDAMVPALSAGAMKSTPRLGFIYIANGVIQDKWIPTTTGRSSRKRSSSIASRRPASHLSCRPA